VFGKVYEPDPMSDIRQERLSRGHGFQDTAIAFFPRSSHTPH
jgi:hypothetical protein